MIYKSNNIKPNLINVIEYVVAFLIILQCNSLFFPNIFKIILQLCIVLLFIYGSINMKRYHNNLSMLFLFLTFFSSFVLIFLLFNLYIYHYALSNFFIFLLEPIMLIIYIYSFVNNNEIDKSMFLKIENLVILFAIISLCFWLLATLGVQPNTYLINNWAEKGKMIPGYFHVSYFSQGITDFLGLNILRNTGLFNEAPMYSYVLSIALLIELFIRKSKLFNYRTIILVVTIISTTSSTGIIVSAVALLYAGLTLNDKNKLFVKWLSILLIPIVIIFIRMIIIDKVGTSNNITSSFNIRIDDIVASFNTWTHHLILGNGIDNTNAIIQYMGAWRLIPNISVGLSTGFMSTLAYGGIVLSLFYILPTAFIMKISVKLKGLAIFSFVLFIFTMISTTSLYILLLSYFWAVFIYDKEKKFERR